MASTLSLEEAGEALAVHLRGRRSGTIEILDLSVEVTEDGDGVPSVNLTARVTDPAADSDTWPLEDVLPLRRDVNRLANEIGVRAPVYLWLKPATESPQEEEEEDPDA